MHPAEFASDSEARETFVEDLQQRGQAAQGLQKDLLTEVPLLYGSPASLEPDGDPGVVLARIHRDQMLRRNGGGVATSSAGETPAALPFEHGMIWLVLLLLAILFFAS